MRHNLFLSLTLSASVGAAALITGCSSEPLLPSKSEEYSREFIKNFGVFDQSHDWNHATQTTVNVTTATPADIKVCAKFDGKLYSFAEYKNVSGHKTLNVDIPKGTTDLIIRANGKNYAVKAGGEVTLNSTASGYRGSRSVEYGKYPVKVNGENKEIVISKTGPEDWRTVAKVDVTGFTNTMPESQLNIYRERVDKDFVFRSVGPIIIYPIYWNTSQSNKLGIAYLDDAGNMQHIELWQRYRSETFDNENNLLGVTTFDKVEELSIQDISTDEDVLAIVGNERFAEKVDPNLITPAEYMAILRHKGIDVKSILKINSIDCDGAHKYNSWNGGNYVHVVYVDNSVGYDQKIGGVGTGDAANFGDNQDNRACAFTKGIKVDIPVGMRYGMYIERGDGTKLYSVADYNPDPLLERDDKGEPTGNYIEGEQAFHAATWIGPKFGWTWLAFEDWLSTEGSDMDLNDMVFLIDNPHNDDDDEIVEIEKPDDPEPEPETWEWIIACEDLGTNDFDFNDVVFSVSAPETVVEGTETKTVTVKALASGGVLPVYLLYDGVELKPDGAESGEFHTWFGKSAGTIINAKDLRTDGMSVKVEVPANFTMACCKPIPGESGNMGGFQVRVHHADGETVQIEATNPNLSEQIGNAPQMICVPHTWKWPKENVHITTVYSRFTDWCANYDAAIKWHENPSGSYWTR